MKLIEVKKEQKSIIQNRKKVSTKKILKDFLQQKNILQKTEWKRIRNKQSAKWQHLSGFKS